MARYRCGLRAVRDGEGRPQEAYGRLREDKLINGCAASCGIPTMAMLNNYDGAAWHMKEMVEMLTNPSSRRIDSRYGAIRVESHQAGIVVDFEQMQTRTSRTIGRSSANSASPACGRIENHDCAAARDDSTITNFRKAVRRRRVAELRQHC